MTEEMTAPRGHSLVELMVALGLVAVLATTAVPSLSRWLLDLRRDSAVAATMHALHVARQLAAVRAQAVSLCGSRDGETCSGGTDWSGGLLVATGDGRPPRVIALAPAPSLRSNRAEIRFEAGSGHASPATLTVCDRRGRDAARAVVVSRSGRPRATGPGEGIAAC